MLEHLQAMRDGASSPRYLRVQKVSLDESVGQLEAAYSNFEQQFVLALEKWQSVLGPPALTRGADFDWSRAWYPEATRLAVWCVDELALYLAFAHHDRESPLLLEAGAVPVSEIPELAAP